VASGYIPYLPQNHYKNTTQKTTTMNNEQYLELIKERNKNRTVTQEELNAAIAEAKPIFQANHNNTVHFERSIFINWTCAIADCKYCYLSTKPKHKAGTVSTALRSHESILAEALICKLMGYEIGYITGGLRVESVDQIIELLKRLNQVNQKQNLMNFGPYAHSEIKKLKPYTGGMGSAIESFDEQLHDFICPSKPLIVLRKFLTHLQEENMHKLITIILGLGENKDDIKLVSENIKKYDINIVQLCFLKPQENTVFAQVPAPDMNYMAYWVAKLRVAHPKLKIKVALVKERMDDLHLLLNAGANGFSRFLIFKEFAQQQAKTLELECKKANRKLLGKFTTLPSFNIKEEVAKLPFDEELKVKILPKAEQYYIKLKKLKNKQQHLKNSVPKPY
jgi:biotin synthase-like enzyme